MYTRSANFGTTHVHMLRAKQNNTSLPFEKALFSKTDSLTGINYTLNPLLCLLPRALSNFRPFERTYGLK